MHDFSNYGAVGTSGNNFVVWIDGASFNLNDLIVTPGVAVDVPTRIGNSGHIVAEWRGPNWRAQVLTPVN